MGSVTVSDVVVAIVTVAATPSTITALLPRVRSNPVPVSVAVPPSMRGSGVTLLSESVVAFAVNAIGEPVSPAAVAAAVCVPVPGPRVQVVLARPSAPVLASVVPCEPPPLVMENVTG